MVNIECALSCSLSVAALRTTTGFVYQSESPDEGALVGAAKDLG
jgi:hypothetical protein